MKAIILARVSTEEQREEGQSIPAQTRRLTDYVNGKKLELLRFFEFAESSTNDTRKKFEQILDLVKSSKETTALVVDTVDRLQRSFKESVILDDFRKAGKIEIHFYRENLVINKNSNSAELLRWDMAVMFARSYVLQLSDNVKRSIEQKLQKGEWITKAPIGYLNITEDGKSDIIPDPAKAPLVARVFELYSSGNMSMKAVGKEMKKHGLANAAGKPLADSMIEHILKNPFYYGVMEKDGKQYPHKYDQIISMNLFLKCQKVRESWNKKPFQYAAKPFAFRGLLTCDECGCIITPELAKGKYVYYSCTNYKGKCKRVYVPEKTLLEPIFDTLRRLELPQDGIDYLVKNLKASTEAEQEFHRNAMAELKAGYDRIENRISKMQDDKYDGSITTENYDKKLKEYKAQQHDYLQQMQEHSKADEHHHLTAARILDICKRAVEIFKSSEPNEKRDFLNFLLQNSRLKDKTPIFTLKPVFQGIVTAQETKQWLGW
jgi:site-specific DNA recombinase